MKIRENVPISELTTMRIGGAARYVIEIEKPEEIPEAYDFAEEKNLPVFIMGGGANTIGRDEGYPGIILINKCTGITVDGERVSAMGGEDWDKVVETACEHGLTGIEALSMIPGTMGAAPVQNIGAYGQEVATVFEAAEVYDTKEQAFKALNRDEMKFSYRKSILNSSEHGRYFVIKVILKLTAGGMQPPFYNSLQRYLDEAGIANYTPMKIRKAVMTIRAQKLPDPRYIASAGSFFKNMYVNDEKAIELERAGVLIWRNNGKNKINAGWLIEQAGLSGKLLHGMRVSEKASLVLINESARGYEDLAAARAEIINTVRAKYGITLEQEPVEISA